MDTETVIGLLLVSGLVTFLVGAIRWRPEYEQALELSLPVKAADQKRLRWIHYWMMIGVGLTSAGVAAVAVIIESPWGVVAVVLYAMGAVAWLIALTFRLTVEERAAAEMVATGTVTPSYPALAAWAGGLHAIHMVTAYLSAIPLASLVLTADLGPAWLGWVGMVWGAGFALGFVLTRGGSFFAPPFWAHVFTGAVGIALLLV